MRDFDRLRSGSITETQFLSCLSMSKLFFTREESVLLIDKYRNPDKSKEVLWRTFCDEIEQVFVVKELEKRNDVHDLKNLTKTTFSLSELSLADQATLQDILREMKRFFEVNRIDPKPAFANYDHLKRGKVLLSQFKKILHSMKYFIGDSMIEILIKKYGDAIPNEINYILILNDANEIGGINALQEEEKVEKNIIPILSSANNFHTYSTQYRLYDSSVEEVINKIKNIVKINRVRLQEFFNDFDTLRKGVVTKAKFRTSINLAK
jgi:DNA integrity scanning protein DisA with diadenylate cyclase activity